VGIFSEHSTGEVRAWGKFFGLVAPTFSCGGFDTGHDVLLW